MPNEKLQAELNLEVAKMMLQEIQEANEVEERSEEVNELLDLIIRTKAIFAKLKE